MILSPRQRRLGALLFLSGIATQAGFATAAGAAPAMPADHCSDSAPALRLEGPASWTAGGEPAVLTATDRCTGGPAAGARLTSKGTRGHVDVDGHVLIQFSAAGTYRLVATSDGERSNTLVVRVLG